MTVTWVGFSLVFFVDGSYITRWHSHPGSWFHYAAGTYRNNRSRSTSWSALPMGTGWPPSCRGAARQLVPPSVWLSFVEKWRPERRTLPVAAPPFATNRGRPGGMTCWISRGSPCLADRSGSVDACLLAHWPRDFSPDPHQVLREADGADRRRLAHRQRPTTSLVGLGHYLPFMRRHSALVRMFTPPGDRLVATAGVRGDV